MTQQAQGDVVQLAAAGVAVASATWRGGRGMLLIDTFNAGGNFEMQTPSGAWVAITAEATNVALTTAANGSFLFAIPSTRIRLSAAGGTMNAWAIGI